LVWPLEDIVKHILFNDCFRLTQEVIYFFWKVTMTLWNQHIEWSFAVSVCSVWNISIEFPQLVDVLVVDGVVYDVLEVVVNHRDDRLNVWVDLFKSLVDSFNNLSVLLKSCSTTEIFDETVSSIKISSSHKVTLKDHFISVIKSRVKISGDVFFVWWIVISLEVFQSCIHCWC